MAARMIALSMSLCCLMLATPAEAGWKIFGKKSTVTAASVPAKPNVFRRAIDSSKAFIYRHSGKIMASGVATTVAGLGVTIYGLGAKDGNTVHTGMIMMGAGAAAAGSMTVPVLDKLLNAVGRGR